MLKETIVKCFLRKSKNCIDFLETILQRRNAISTHIFSYGERRIVTLKASQGTKNELSMMTSNAINTSVKHSTLLQSLMKIRTLVNVWKHKYKWIHFCSDFDSIWHNFVVQKRYYMNTCATASISNVFTSTLTVVWTCSVGARCTCMACVVALRTLVNVWNNQNIHVSIFILHSESSRRFSKYFSLYTNNQNFIDFFLFQVLLTKANRSFTSLDNF
jgi:hypothetical protein